ncbi:hypothetical protein EAG21025_20910 [Enterobacter asburiae]|uniref:hypothetical protein n=1 Tax=Enterobacter asburiae TaxID=61645 RepID=UPI0034E87CF9
MLFDATVFTERDNSRLEELKKKTLIGACYLVRFGGLFFMPGGKVAIETFTWRIQFQAGMEGEFTYITRAASFGDGFEEIA